MTADRVTISLPIPAAPESVWQALTLARSAWWPGMDFEASPGAPLHETWTEDGVTRHARGVVTAVEPPLLLAFDWTEPSWSGHLSVEVRLIPDGESTEVTITEQGFQRAGTPPTLPAQHEAGWHQHLRQLSEAVQSDLRACAGRGSP
ncbi:SRPBCC family protein [Nesterenkonia sandarakina]|uniref:Uncharacterized protein YndB with AHSA1/START domain n=1 Tax=Nesterenkonia sandarakina TaxID=272918 RepID=A0A2T0YR04_9MICC|nr:SRPBCC domain-containing protein [Nesterenkonia sandarakina]PRZ17842.1 uncharacterized protein YndB with AHSA1/START domain [Nesterenkonia sandarakina]